MTAPRRPTLALLAAAVGIAALFAAPLAWTQTAETFKSGGPIAYTTYLKRTGQSPPAARAKPKVKKPATPAIVKTAPTVTANGQAPSSPPPSRPASAAPARPTVPAPVATPSVAPAQKPVVSPPAPALVATPTAAPPPPAPAPAPAPKSAYRLPSVAPIPSTPTPAGARLAPSAPLPAGELEAFVDGAVRQAMGADHIAGAAVVVVQDGQVLLEKGYGLARLSPAAPVDPRATLFRLGSVSKVLTWIEVLKQVEAGRLNPDAPLDDALPEQARLGTEGFREPLRLRHLMNHTGGFEARELGRLFKADPRRLLGPDAALTKARSRRVREAGKLSSYSNYGVALAGAAAAHAGKAAFDRLIEDDLLKPAGLASTTFREPYPADPDLPEPMAGDLAARLSQGFRFTRAGYAPQDFEFGQDFAPAVAASATLHDMGRLMQMLLGAPAPWGPGVQAALFTPLPSPAPGLPGWTYGLQQQPLAGGFSGFGQGGATLWSKSRLLVAPQLRLGVFVVTNTDRGQSLADRLPGAVVARFYAPPPTPAALGAPQPAIDARRYAGLYLTTRRAYHGLEGMMNRLTRAERVFVGEDGRLTVTERGRQRQFLPAGPDRFASLDGAQVIAFPADPAHPGAPARLMLDPARGEGAVREDWLHQPAVLGAAVATAGLAALLCLVGAIVRLLRDERQTRAQASAGWVQTIAALAWLMAIAGAMTFLHAARDPAVPMYHWPSGWLVTGSWAAVIATLLGVAQLFQLRDVWADTRRLQSWPVGRRLRHTVTVVVFLAFSGVLATWGALFPWSS